MSSCGLGLIVIDAQGLIVEINQPILALFGYKAEELVGQEVEKLIPVNLYKKHKGHIEKYFKKPEAKKLGGGDRILTGVKKCGTKIYVEVRVNHFFENGKAYGVASIVDITREHKMRELLYRTQEVARIGSWQANLKENKCTWSKITYDIHELDPEVEVLIEDGINFYAEEHQPIIRALVEKGFAEKKSWDVELKIVTATKNKKWVRAIGNPVIENGEVVGLEGTFQDIHEQKLLQLEREEILKKLKITEVTLGSLTERHSLALEASKVGIWEWNIQSNELIWDKQMYDLYGIREEDFDGAYTAWLNGLHPDDQGDSTRKIEEAINENKRFDTTFRVVWPSGEVRFIKALASHSYDQEGKPLKMVGANWDITKIVENESKLSEVNQSLEIANYELMQFAYRSSHDLKAPLVSIRRLGEVILDDIQDDEIEEVTKNVNSIMNQARTLENLVQDLLELAKADISDEKLEVINFKDLVKDVISLNTVLADKNKVKCLSKVEVEDSWIFPKARVFQIINNLVSNSVKYCDFGKENRFVEVLVQEENNEIVFIIKDNGTGIPYTKKEDVFAIFKRFHTKDISGSGFGMYVLKKHVDSLGGVVDYESDNKGTVFTVKLRKR